MSLRLRLLNGFLRLAIKPRLARLSAPDKARHDLERAARWLFRTPPFSLVRPVSLGARPALEIENRPASQPPPRDRIILYFHGGGYAAGSPRSHAKMLARLSRLVQMTVIAPQYRLAPEHPFPAAFNDAVDAFDALVVRGFSPHNIVLGGDSAGGGLALALMAHLCARGRAPGAVFAFSPLTDFRFASDSMRDNAGRDPVLPASNKDVVARMYLAGHDASDPRVSPLLARFDAPPPPVFLQCSQDEILRDDSRAMAEHLREAGGEVVLDIQAGAPHVWVLFDGLIPEARPALRRAAAFVRRQFSDEMASR